MANLLTPEELARFRPAPAIAFLHGDALTRLRSLPTGSVHCCVTSPPYFGLRDYGVEGQIGIEPTPDEYVAAMVEVFREIRRVLRNDGTCWLNLGDSYNADGRKGRAHMGVGKNSGYSAWVNKTCEGTKPKDLLGIPWMAAFALRADGWYLRSDIIWHKPNPMPESIKDRPTSAHEHVFLLTKQASYFYDAFAIAEESVGQNAHDLTGGRHSAPGQAPHTGSRKALRNATESRHRSSIPGGPSMQAEPTGTRNARNVWSITTKPFISSYLDFAGADYVDDHGTPRKLSPDCPVHGLRGLLQQGTRGVASCDEQAVHPGIHTSTGDRLSQGQTSAGAPIGCYTAPTLSDNQPTSIPDGTSESKRPAPSPCAAGERTPQSSGDTQGQPAPSTMGCDSREGFQIATWNSTQNRRTDRDLGSSAHDMLFEELPLSTPRTERRLFATPLCERIDESKIEAPQPSSHGKGTAPSEHESRTSRTQSGKSSKRYKCMCAISKGAHFATMPRDLAERCIKAGTSEAGCCPSCKAPFKRIVVKGEVDPEWQKACGADVDGEYHGQSTKGHAEAGVQDASAVKARILAGLAPKVTVGWEQTCECPPQRPIPCLVLDPFSGAGTTALAAQGLGRDAVGIELNATFIEMANERVGGKAIDWFLWELF